MKWLAILLFISIFAGCAIPIPPPASTEMVMQNEPVEWNSNALARHVE